MSAARKIIDEVAETHGFLMDDMLSKRRTPDCANARFHAAYRLRRELGLSYPAIARHMGWGNHTTALHAVGSHYALLQGLPKQRKMTAFARRVEVLPDALERRVAGFSLPPSKNPLAPEKPLATQRATGLDATDQKVMDHAFRRSFVVSWLADSGDPLEALGPYGFNASEAAAFMRVHLPELAKLKGATRRSKAKSMMLEMGVAV